MADRVLTQNFDKYAIVYNYICALPNCGRKFKCVHKNVAYCTSECQVIAKRLGILVTVPIEDNPTKNPRTAHTYSIFDCDHSQGEIL